MPATLLELLRDRAERYGDKVAFDYSPDGEAEHGRLTYRELDTRARAIASSLHRQGAAGERVLVLCPSGLDFIAGLFGCFYAGAVAVPVHPPVHNRLISRVASIVADTQAGFVLSTAETQAELKAVVDGLPDGGSLRWSVTDAVAPDAAAEWVPPDLDPSATAFVQYTSGSTTTPKGVVLTHRNLIANLEAIGRDLGQGDNTHVVSWLPLHHDMGLIGGVLAVLYVGGNCALMPPAAFIQRPMRWLEAISRSGAGVSVGPNFALDLCVDTTSAEERAALDLSNWSRAYCGAEPVRAATLQRFAEAFAPAGFRPETFHPVYGLAEATLLVSGRAEYGAAPAVRHVDGVALRGHEVVAVAPEHPAATVLIGCGQASHGQEIVIVDPLTRRPCRPHEVGEIWVGGASVAQGYLGKPAETKETFSAFLSETGRGPFLRTGDLGFLLDGELFVPGRLKDLVIIRGRNYYPNDIEATAQGTHPALLSGRGAAFAVTPESGGSERLIVVQEVDRSQVGEADLSEVIGAIRTAITAAHDIQAHAVVLVEPLRIPTTSSGKIRRSTCRQRFLDGQLEVLAEWHAPTSRDPQPSALPAEEPRGRAGRGADEIAAWFVSRLSAELGLIPTEIDTSQPFAYYGLDSVHSIRLTTELEAWLGRKMSPTLAYDYPTIDLLSRHLAEDADDAPADTRTTAAAESNGGVRANGAGEPIAIIGIGCRFPGADGPSDFWRLLCDGVDAVTEIPPDRWDADASVNATTRWGGFLDQIDRFDPQFFGISPREAARTDPQQRLMLEVAWEALEDAGQVPERLAGSRTGVFVGISTSDYGNFQLGQPALIDAYTGTGSAMSIAANRLSYFYDFRGPSMAVDTACSSSLVAIDLACRSLRDGGCTLALAGGVNVIVSPAIGISFSRAGVTAADGRCKTFDARADGWVRGEGAGIVVLKPLSQALADADPIYAVIRGSAINQDGRTNGLMAPNRLSQEAVLAEAYRRAGVSPGAVQYVEAQGSGTVLGDAIEAEALGTILAEGRTPDSRCLIGSVKTNIGHLEAAAGVAGLIKVALALRHRAIPASLNFAEPNPNIPFDSLPLRVADTLTPWPENGGRAVAGVSAFGFGGTNAHVVLAEAPHVRITEPEDNTAEDRTELLPLSARSPEALAALASRYELALMAGAPLADLCYTAGARRSHHGHRLAVVGGSPAELSESLAAYREGVPHPGLSTGRCAPGGRPGVVFLFSGEGSQWCGMGQRLYSREPTFRDALAKCDRAVRPHLEGSPLSEILADRTDSRLSDVGIVQPAIFAVQVALAALWRSWGVEPEAVIGHGMGEVAAAHVAGALSLEDAALLICGRARLLRRASGRGAMIAAELSPAEAQELIAGRQSRVAVAAHNSHRSTVLSGDMRGLIDVVTELQERGRSTRWLNVDVASHSPEMDGLRADLRNMLAALQPGTVKVPMYSTVTGSLLNGRALDDAYWADNLCSTVRFSAAVRQLLGRGHDTFLEISPHPMLLNAIYQDANDLGRSCTLLSSLRRDEGDRATMLASLGTLYSRGQSVAWEHLHPWGGRCVAAPTYPWQRDRFWLGTTAESSSSARRAAPQRLVSSEIETGTEPMPNNHRLNGLVVLPPATLMKYVSAAATGAFGAGKSLLREVVSRSLGGNPPAGDARGFEAGIDILRCAPGQERQRLLEAYLRDHAASKLGLTPSRLDIQLPLNHLGVDSLIAAELRAQIERDLGIVVPVVKLLEWPSVAGLADWLGDQLSGGRPTQLDPTVSANPSATQPNGVPAQDATDVAGARWIDLLGQVPDLSDDDVDELLREVLAAGEGPDTSIDIASLSAGEKRVLLSRLLKERAEVSASAHPLSYGQRSMWFLHRLAPGSPAYTITYAGRISGDLDVPALEHAAQALVDRHAILRTTYTVRDDQPVQLVHPQWPVRIARHDIGSDERALDEWLRRESNRPFDLETGPVFRLTLVRRTPHEHVLVLVLHHIAVDFWSIDVILDELRLLYAAQRGAEPPPPCPERYIDHVDRQMRMLAGEDGERLWQYWQEQLAGDLPILRLPIDRPQPVAQTYRGAVHRFTLDSRFTAGLKKAGQSVGATPYMTLFAAYATLLHRYSGHDDLLIGSPFACREHAGVEGVVGYLANPLVLRTDLHGDPTFTSLLGRVRETVLDALAHQDYPFTLLVERLRPVRDPGHAPLFQVSFAWEQHRRFRDGPDGTGATPNRAALDLETIHIGQGGAPLDLMMLMGERDGELVCALQYNTDLFDEATIERMAGHFATLLEGIVADPGKRLSELPLLTETERREQAAWNETRVCYDAPECLHEIVAATARRNPTAIAVSYEDSELTYTELDRRADALGHRLQRLGVGPDTIVPVLLDRSADLVVALLAVLKAGGAVMPLDPAQPTSRIAAMLSDAPGLPVCVTHRRHLERLPGFGGHRLCLDELPAALAENAVAAPAGTTSASLAYVIFTSGSTGVPKAALNTHAGIRNRLLWMQQTDPLTADDRVLHQTPVTFDVSVLEIFWPLIAGARLVIAKPDGHKDTGYLVRTIAEKSVTAAFFVASMLRAFLAEEAVTACVGLRRVSCGGEVVPYELAQRFLATLDAELWNEYGPAEAAITATYFQCKRGAPGPTVPIGRPIANVRVHLLDAHLQPVPVGVPGELCIGGVGVGRGYLNRPDATAASFIPDPFADDLGQLLYRTGDLARYLPDGNIEYLGRLDDQVKVRGVRIEPAEVEAALEQHPGVRESAVVAGNDGRGNPRLVGHVVAAGEVAPSTAELRRFLLERLPSAMVPAVFCVTEAFPRTSSGKVDRRALAAAAEAAPVQEAAFVAPRTPAEKILAEIWRDVLDVDRIGVHDDFFALGGCSTHSLEVAVKAKAAGLPLTPESVFLCGTIAELAAEYAEAAKDGADRGDGPRDGNGRQDVGSDAVEAEPAAPSSPVPVRAVSQKTRNTVIESIGTYLPAEVVSTETVLAGCVNEIGIPLERLTGIKNRRMAGRREFSIDLARQAIVDCLARSSYGPEEIDLVISCNISRCDGPGYKFVFEPSTAARLREQCGLANALAFDVTNACAGMWTGINVADAFLQTGLVQRAMVVSGEYITHLTNTAQREIEGPMDARLACLTLGDAGAAVILERGANNRVGFHDIDMATFGKYSNLCVAKVSDGPLGGATMVTDSIAGTAVAVKAAVPYVSGVMRRHGWRPEHCDHIVIHQTSEASLNDAIVAFNRSFGAAAAHPGNTIFNLAERGNTASTTHFVALKDHILANRIKSGDNAVFAVSGSGQTVGAGLYTFDDLPDRLRRGSNGQPGLARSTGRRTMEPSATPRVCIAGVGTVAASPSAPQGSVQLAVQAAAACLEDSGLDREAIGLLIHAGVYRDEYVSEPAIAAFIAGELGVNDDAQSPDGPKTLAFDVLNGAVGFLNACHVATQMIGAGKAEHAMVVAAEIENNTPESGHPLLGISETGSAVLLRKTDGTAGFGRFVFHHHPEHADALATYTRHDDGQTWLQIDRDPKLTAHYLDCIPAAVEELLRLEGLDRSEIAVVFPPFLHSADRTELAVRINIPSPRFVDLPAHSDPFSSSLPYGLEQAWRHGRVSTGDVGLIVSVGSGLQVGCTTYRF